VTNCGSLLPIRSTHAVSRPCTHPLHQFPRGKNSHCISGPLSLSLFTPVIYPCARHCNLSCPCPGPLPVGKALRPNKIYWAYPPHQPSEFSFSTTLASANTLTKTFASKLRFVSTALTQSNQQLDHSKSPVHSRNTTSKSAYRTLTALLRRAARSHHNPRSLTCSPVEVGYPLFFLPTTYQGDLVIFPPRHDTGANEDPAV
jgi:hypothetical protein